MQKSCQFNMVWLKRTGLMIGALGVLLLSGFFLFTSAKKTDLQAQIHQEETVSEEDLELKRKIGQMIMVGFRGFSLIDNPEFKKQVEEGMVGGVVLFDYDTFNKTYQRNIKNKEQVANLIKELQNISPEPLLIAVDEEGGYVERLKEAYGFKKDISAEKIGEQGKEVAFQSGLRIGNELKEVGINMNFAPVVDVALNPQSQMAIKLARAFSTSSKEVGILAEQFILGQNKAGIISVVKHFPGHGSLADDSLVDISNTFSEEELMPYYYLQSKGLLRAVMTGHLINRNIDPSLPATLSPLFLENILREQIGFQGLIVSDDLQMKAIADNFGFKEAVIKAVNAGCNLLVLSNNTGSVYDNQIAEKAKRIIFQAVKEGQIPEEKVDQSFDLISSLKK